MSDSNGTTPVTTVIARAVRKGSEADYERWLTGISKAAANFPGNQGTTIIRPGHGRDEYVTVLHFDSADNMQRWLGSPDRGQWLEKLEAICVDREEVSRLEVAVQVSDGLHIATWRREIEVRAKPLQGRRADSSDNQWPSA